MAAIVANAIQSVRVGVSSYPGTGLAVVTGLGCLYWCIRDYQAFLALGPGGLPYNLKGWAIVTFLVRPFTLRAKDTTYTGDYPSEGAHEEVSNLPARSAPRAEVMGIAPHRQLSQRAPERMRQPLTSLFDNAVKNNPDLLETKLSLYERHGPAIFVTEARVADSTRPVPETTIVSRGELGHVHTDLSIHLYLAPADAKVAIEKGWGERHRLARTRKMFGKHLFGVTGTFLMIYGPRDHDELAVVQTLLRNSIKFMTGESDVMPFAPA